MKVSFAVTAGLVAIAMLGGLLLTDNVVVAAAPLVIAATIWATFTLPLRYPLLALGVAVMGTDVKGDGSSIWASPFQPLGTLLSANLNKTIPVSALAFSGTDALLGVLFVIAIVRKARKSPVDRADVQPATAMTLGWLSALGGLALAALHGLMGGGTVNQIYWQVHQVALIPIVGMLFAYALRGPRDHKAVAIAIILAAFCKAAMAILARQTAPGDFDLMPYATSHQDSMLFACSLSILIAYAMERFGKSSLLLAAVLSPVLILGMIANHRRLVWVEVAATVALFGVVGRWTPLKRFAARAAVLSMPLGLVYLVVGWSSDSRIFAPVQTIRSVVESKVNRSTQTRDVENYNLYVTMTESSMVLGLGLGREYTERVKMDDISRNFEQWRYLPHNSILGLWAFCGLIGFTAIWMMLVISAYLAARSYRLAERLGDRCAALASLSTILIYGVQCYGDMGLLSWVSVFTVAPAMAVAAKLAVATGAFPARTRRPRAVPAAVFTPQTLEATP